MLCHISVHDLVKELDWVFLGHLIVNLSFLWLHNVSLAWGCYISDGIFIGIKFTFSDLIAEEALMLDSGIFLGTKTSGWRLVLLHVVAVELAHDRVEFVHAKGIDSGLIGGDIFVGKQVLELSLDGTHLGLKIWVHEKVVGSNESLADSRLKLLLPGCAINGLADGDLRSLSISLFDGLLKSRYGNCLWLSDGVLLGSLIGHNT